MKDSKILRSWDLLVLGVIICCALFYYTGRINYKFIDTTGDNYSYEIIAQSVFTTSPFKINVKFDFYDDHPIFHHQRSFPPLYPIMLAIFHVIFGNSMYINILASCVLGILCAFPIFFLGKLIGNSRCGLVTVLLTVFSCTLVETSLLSMSEPLFTLFSITSLYFFVSYEFGKKKKDIVLAGVFSGLAYLTRTNGVATIIAFTFFILIKEGLQFKQENFKRISSELLLYLSSAVLIALPWLIRNYLIFGDPFYYVGRFFSGLKPDGFYSSIYEQAPTIGRFLSSSSFKEIFNRYSISFFKHLKLIWTEMSLVSLIAVFSLFKSSKPRSINLILGLYILFNVLISLFHPSTYSRHIINIFPALFLLASLLVTSDDLKKYWAEKHLLKCISIILLLYVFLAGSIMTIYSGLTYKKEIDLFSQEYVTVGKWLRENTPSQSVVMSTKTSPIAYYSQRPVMMMPLNISPVEFDRYVRKYNVNYIAAVLYGGYIPRNFKKEMVFYKKKQEGLYGSFILYVRKS